MTAIILLNWNGWEDTIECLESLRACQTPFYTLIADNGSEDDSLPRIKDYMAHHWDSSQYEILPLPHNEGFARGNNLAIQQLRQRADIDAYLILNNDTVVMPDFLDQLLAFHHQHPHYSILTPLICYHSHPDCIWNAGGKQKWGWRTYYYANQSIQAIPQRSFLPITFVTGCALWVTTDVLTEQGLFTERFFFGEEDFEFCLRMNQAHRPMACVLSSRIYHKVSQSSKQRPSVNKIYLHYLNRFIDMRLHLSPVRYKLWVLMNIGYIIPLLIRNGMGLSASITLLHRVIAHAMRQDCVTHEDFTSIMQHPNILK